MKTYAGKNALNILKVKLLKILICCIRQSPVYHSYIHSYINYGNIAWRNSTRTNLKKIYSQQKHAVRIVHSKNRLSHTRELFKECKVLMYIK